ncbi:hypothetical protein N7537_009099 [Penicillium hordei]|uniref:Uncharacterized protein n=1 Tax=Penicillium hordei TaxID=40994 RepID=A0AAD6DSW4_9EURO|nr:uncharacterized protein N7537_009099 [Penicillium hordei]KAJ5592195.1 hypothetical protein N7537_009099 [Penicillium hordei]
MGFVTNFHLKKPGTKNTGHQEAAKPDPRNGDPVTREDFYYPKVWRVVNHYQYTGLPHSAMSCLAHIRSAKTNHGLITHELIAIMNTMLLRVNHRPFRRCHIHPSLSFMGDQKGKFIQASWSEPIGGIPTLSIR